MIYVILGVGFKKNNSLYSTITKIEHPRVSTLCTGCKNKYE